MTASAWTQDRIDRLRILWLEGRSADWIARDLAAGITRNAVLGKVHRMGLSAGRPSASTRPTAPIPPEPKVVLRPRRPGPPPEPAASPGGVSLLAVRRCECRWPLGDPLASGFSLCGRTVARGAYCDDHARIAYRPSRETPQSLERLARLN